jgi:hypothetical protein
MATREDTNLAIDTADRQREVRLAAFMYRHQQLGLDEQNVRPVGVPIEHRPAGRILSVR